LFITNMKTKTKKLNEKPGWVKLHRKMLDWEWYDNLNVWRVFIHCLLMANFKDKKWHGKTIKRGSFVTSSIKLAKEVCLGRQQTRTALNKLKLTNEITIKTTSKYTEITVNNYNRYQQDNQHNNQRVTSNQPQLKKDKKDKNIYISGKGRKKSQSEVERIYSSYKNLINPNSRLTKAGREKIRVRLKTYSVAELIKAMTNFSQDSWWMEHNSSRGVAWFFHNDERIDQLINLKPKGRWR